MKGSVERVITRRGIETLFIAHLGNPLYKGRIEIQGERARERERWERRRREKKGDGSNHSFLLYMQKNHKIRLLKFFFQHNPFSPQISINILPSANACVKSFNPELQGRSVKKWDPESDREDNLNLFETHPSPSSPTFTPTSNDGQRQSRNVAIGVNCQARFNYNAVSPQDNCKMSKTRTIFSSLKLEPT